MRYTTARFGEVANLFGKMRQEALSGEINIELYASTDGFASAVALTASGCSEISGSRAGGFATYYWPTSFITAPVVNQTEYLYLMRDTVTGRVHEGKFVIGGFPDESARGRYQGQVHVTPDGTALPTIASGTATCTFTASGIIRSTGSWVTDGFAAAIGNLIQVRNAVNRGVAPALVSITTTTNPNDTLNFYPNEPFTPSGPEAGVIVVAKEYVFPAGTEEAPIAPDVYDARQIGDLLSLPEYHITRGVTLDVDFNHDRWAFTGNSQQEDVVNLISGNSVEGARFFQTKLTGGLNGSIIGDDCILENLSGVKGVFQTTALSGVVYMASGGEFVGDKVASRGALPATQIDFSAGGSPSFLAGSVQGVFTISNMANGTVGISMAGTILTAGPTCTGGTIQAIGYGSFDYTNAGGSLIIDQLLPNALQNADQVWNELLAGHQAANSAGRALSGLVNTAAIISGYGAPPTAAAIADQVWDEALAGHLAAGSTGLALSGARTTLDAISGFGAPPTVGAIADQVWDEALAGHLTAGSAGEALANVSGSVVTPATIADAVWDEALAGHVGAGSAAQEVLTARKHVTNAREIDRTTSPWEEVVYDDDGVTEIQRATLSGGDGSVAAITNANRPTGVLISKRDPV